MLDVAEDAPSGLGVLMNLPSLGGAAGQTPMRRPLLMTTAMVATTLAGLKTETRRLMSPQPDWLKGEVMSWKGAIGLVDQMASPYGRPGDLLWLKEDWRVEDGSVARGRLRIGYRDGSSRWVDVPCAEVLERLAADLAQAPAGAARWRRARFMFGWASRALLEVVEVRAERLQDITFAGAVAEGLQAAGKGWQATPDAPWHANPVHAYRWLWDAIHGPGAWDANPYVWVVGFDVAKVER